MEPLWNLTSGPPRTIPEPILAETPKLSAVGEKRTPNGNQPLGVGTNFEDLASKSAINLSPLEDKHQLFPVVIDSL